MNAYDSHRVYRGKGDRNKTLNTNQKPMLVALSCHFKLGILIGAPVAKAKQVACFI